MSELTIKVNVDRNSLLSNLLIRKVRGLINAMGERDDTAVDNNSLLIQYEGGELM